MTNEELMRRIEEALKASERALEAIRKIKAESETKTK